MKTLIAITLSLAAWTCSIQAGLDGSLVNLSVYYPNTSTLFGSPGANVTVSAAIEYPLNSGPQANGAVIDFTDTKMIIHWTPTFNQIWSSSPFNGYIVKVISGPTILSAAIEPTSSFFPGVSVVGGELYVNAAGVTYTAGGTATIDITTTPVPEPSTYLAGLSALGMLGFFGWRNRK